MSLKNSDKLYTVVDIFSLIFENMSGGFREIVSRLKSRHDVVRRKFQQDFFKFTQTRTYCILGYIFFTLF